MFSRNTKIAAARGMTRLRRLGTMLAVLVAVGMGSASWAFAQEKAPPAGAPTVTVEAGPAGALPANESSGGFSMGMTLLLTVLVFVVSGMLGNWLSKTFRLPDQGLKFGVIVFSVLASLFVTILGWPPKLGIDLSGGVILVYGVDESQVEPGQNVDMDKLVGAITRRVNPGGIKEVTVRPYGKNEVEIIIPKATAEELTLIKDIIATSGALEFRIVANTRDHGDIITRAKEVKDSRVLEDGKMIARWVPIAPDETAALVGNPSYATRVNAKGRAEALIVIGPDAVTGQYLRSAAAGVDSTGRPCVTFSFDSKGSQLFGELTAANLPDQVQGFKRNLAIILDNELITAPSINSVIYDRGEITGAFTQEDTTRLAAVLTAGQLPAVLHREPSSSLLTGPTLGLDTIHKGVMSMVISTIVVVVFMLIYYRFAGIVANVAVVLNVLLTVAFMIMLHAAFTLSGLAGLALTVGMAVDANVLIYERMREELARGATLRMAIRNGFDRATTTIIDANVTTLISAVVLYVIGTDQVKGFAVTLILGIVMNLFTAITVSRAIFEVAERNRWLTTLKMMKVLANTNYDFIGKRRIAIALSTLVIGIGMIGVGLRGKGLLDIDFTGGVSVETLFDRAHPQDVSEVRRKVQDLPDVTVQDVHITGEPAGVRFLIVTSEPDIVDVEERLKTIFKGELAYNELTFGPMSTIGKAAPAETKKPEAKQGAQRDSSWDNLLALADAPAAGAPTATDAAPPTAAKPAADAKAPDKPAADAKAPAAADAKAPAAPADEAKKPAADAKAGEVTDPLAGGTKVELKLTEPISHDALEHLLRVQLEKDPRHGDAAIQLDSPHHEAGSEKALKDWELQVGVDEALTRSSLEAIKKQLVDSPFFPSSNKIGATVADNTKQQAVVALLAAIALIGAYVWFRFTQWMFGLATILALVHDVLVTLGALALSYWLAPYLGFMGVEPFKINLPIIAAFLTIIGYSLNDTIVIFDRIREIRGKSTDLGADLVNLSINQTLSRTLLTSLTVFLVVVILYAVGGQGIHGFAFALVIGVITGTYSTVYIATPVIIWLNRSHNAAGQAKPGQRKSPASAA